jgi:RNA polymerase I-specific transcription initiation factor RRN3
MLGGTINAELNTFPFDPYRLPKSNVYIQTVYREWSTVAIDDDEDEDEDDDDVEGGTGCFGSSGQLKIPQSDSHGDDEVGLGESLGKMSISPMRPQPVRTSVYN